jgi:putative polyhydroxyalkanoate system protein
VADIHIVRAHSMPLKKARAAADKFATELNDKFDLESSWQGDTLNFSRSGVSGTLELSATNVTIDAKLGFLLSAFKSTFEEHIERNLDTLFGAAKAAPKKKKA